MASSISTAVAISTTVAHAGSAPNISNPLHPDALHRGPPLQREGARYFPSAAEQALEDAMMRSSPPPETALGKRARPGDELPDDNGDETEPEEVSSTRPPQATSTPSISNVMAATLRYASKKKLRAEQRDEVEAFLLVSTSWSLVGYLSETLIRTHRLAARPSYLHAYCRWRTKLMPFDQRRHHTNSPRN